MIELLEEFINLSSLKYPLVGCEVIKQLSQLPCSFVYVLCLFQLFLHISRLQSWNLKYLIHYYNRDLILYEKHCLVLLWSLTESHTWSIDLKIKRLCFDVAKDVMHKLKPCHRFSMTGGTMYYFKYRFLCL
jgi:hypothetical protein